MSTELATLLINNGIEVGALILSAVISYLLVLAKRKANFDEQLLLDIRAAVDTAYTGFVRPLKRELNGDSMSVEQKNEARRIAIENLLSLGETRGVDYIKKYGIRVLGAMVESCVKSAKK